MAVEEYLVVEARIRAELDNLGALERELAGYGLYPSLTAQQIGGFDLADTAALRIVGSILHDLYTTVENILETVAGRLDKSLPTGAQWHSELLSQMSLDISGVRTPVLSRTTVAALDSLRAFRHVFRNVYGFHLSPNRIKELLEALPGALGSLRADLDAFMGGMRVLLELDSDAQ